MGWFVQIALALQYLHSNRIVHGDIKSSNIFVNDNTQFVAVGDLGSAFVSNIPFYINTGDSNNNNNNNKNRITNPQLQFQMLLQQHNSSNEKSSLPKSWEHTAYGGTINYFSPERMLNGFGASYQGDVWALGILLAETAAMIHPYSDCRDVNQLVVRVSRGDVPQLPSTVLAAAGSRDMQNLLNFILQADPVKRPTIDDILSHPYVKKHMERFFTMLMSPPPEIYFLSSQQSNTTNNSSNAKNNDRWNRFVVGTDKLNPHRVILHNQLESQMTQFAPAFSNSYFAGLNIHNNSNNNGINIDTSNSRISIPRTNLRMQHHPPVLKTLEDQAEVKSFLHATNASLSPSRHYVNTTPNGGGGGGNNNNNGKNASKNSNHNTTNRQQQQQAMHVGGFSSLNSSDPSNHNFASTGVVAPEHISPDALKPFLHQQIPLSQIRGQKSSAPFWVDEKISPFKNQNISSNNTTSLLVSSPPSPQTRGKGSSSKLMAETIAPFLQQNRQQQQQQQANVIKQNNSNNSTVLLSSSSSPQREQHSGGGPSSFAPAPYSSVQRTIAKVLGM